MFQARSLASNSLTQLPSPPDDCKNHPHNPQLVPKQFIAIAMTTFERSTSWNSTKGKYIPRSCIGLALSHLFSPTALPPKVLSLPFSVCSDSPSVRHATPTFSAPLAHLPNNHTHPNNTDDAFGLEFEFGDLLVDTDHSHSLMEVTAMVSVGTGLGEGVEILHV